MNLLHWFLFVHFSVAAGNLKQNTQKLYKLLKAVHNEVNFETLVYVENGFGKPSAYHSADTLLSQLQADFMPVLQLDGDHNKKIETHFNSKMLVLLLLKPTLHLAKGQLKNLWLKLENMTQVHTILFIEHNVASQFVQEILTFCVENKATNSLALTPKILKQYNYYGLKLFPALNVELKSFMRNNTKIFPNHIVNMQQYPIRVVRNAVATKTYFYTNKKGQRVYSGVFGRFFTTFAEKHNATLSFPGRNKFNSSIFRDIIDQLLQNNSHDMAAEMTEILPKPNISYTNFYNIMDWCLMVPVERTLPSYLSYVTVYDVHTVSLLLLAYVTLVINLKFSNPHLAKSQLAFNTLSGLLGLAFHMPKTFSCSTSFLQLIICFTGLIFNALYAGQISSFKTSPSTEPRLTSVLQLPRRGYKLVMFENELKYMPPNQREKIPLFILDNYEEYLKMRDSRDTHYAYFTSSLYYAEYFAQLQQFSTTGVFRLTDICWKRQLMIRFPLQKNSIYLPAINTLIGQVHQAGLLLKWKRQCFLEFLQMKRIKLEDFGKKYKVKSLSFDDLWLVCALIAVGFTIAILSFLLEFLAYKLSFLCLRRTKKLKA